MAWGGEASSHGAWRGDRGRVSARLELIRALFPDLASDLDAAAARHAAPGAAASLDDRLDAAAARLLPQAAFADIDDRGARSRVERSFAAARAACAWMSVDPPEPEAFAAAGVDFARLGAELASDPSLTAVPAPFGCGADVWRAAVAAATDASPDAVRETHGAYALVLASEAEHEFGVLDAAPAGAPVATSSGVPWTLRLIPAGVRPPVLGLGFAHGPHVTLPEMLMLQLMLLAEGEQPVDSASFTWLAGALADGRLAARHVYDESERTIRITCREIGNQGPHLGARTPRG
ncbi:hypothetical protein SAMN04488565_2305 [Leucobacter chromiiresistens]|uniref:Uncharacterized protein n=1 Tax=Leucobacter chromiiresistens TaxID=1079994 RepID=A0A1H1A3K1_9MICO|nr:hypothetical protein SAMN04488565_2305 [Leucobacter chromiiresistens]